MLPRTIFLVFALIAALPTPAAEFAVAPMLINIDSAGGTEEPFEISVTGKQNGKISLSVFAMEQQSSGHMNFIEAAENAGPLDWIRFEKRNFDIRRDESTVIRGSVRAPRTAKGTYLAAIMVEEDTGDASNNIVIKVRYAVILNINVGAHSGRVVTEFADVQIVEFEGRSYVEGYFTNGNSHMGFLDSSVQVRGADRRLVGQLPLRTGSAWQRGDEQSRVYPGATVRVFAEVPKPLRSGDYSLLVRNQFNGRVQPVFRETIAYTSTLIDESTDAALVAVASERIEIKPLASGLSLTPVALKNPSSEPVTVDLPSGADPASGVSEFKFIPAKVTLQPGALRRVMLKQSHLQDFAFQGKEFRVMAVSDSGRSEELVIATWPGEGE